MSVAHNGEARLKWPDDLLNDGDKCTVILLERAGDSIVIGIGVNLVAAAELPDRPTVCFADKGVTIDRDRFAEVLAVALTDALWTWRHEGIDRITAAWTAHAHPIGRSAARRVGKEGVSTCRSR